MKEPQQKEGGICCGPFIPDIRSDTIPDIRANDIGISQEPVRPKKITDQELKAAVAEVILKPGDPCDPDGVFNE